MQGKKKLHICRSKLDETRENFCKPFCGIYLFKKIKKQNLYIMEQKAFGRCGHQCL